MYKINLTPNYSRITAQLINLEYTTIDVEFEFCLSEYLELIELIKDRSSILLNTKHESFGTLCQYIITNDITDIEIEINTALYKVYKQNMNNRSWGSSSLTAWAGMLGGSNNVIHGSSNQVPAYSGFTNSVSGSFKFPSISASALKQSLALNLKKNKPKSKK